MQHSMLEMIQSHRSLTEKTNKTEQKQFHGYTLFLLPWFLFNFKSKLTSRHVKEVSEQRMENGCLLQQPEEEGHWIRSQELLLVP